MNRIKKLWNLIKLIATEPIEEYVCDTCGEKVAHIFGLKHECDLKEAIDYRIKMARIKELKK